MRSSVTLGVVAQPTESADSDSLEVSRLRKIALFASIAGATSALIPLWNGVLMMGAARARPLDFWLVAVALLASATMPVFNFALYQNQGTLYFSRYLRYLALAAAIVLTLLLAMGLPQRIGLLASYLSALRTVPWRTGTVAMWSVVRDPRTIYHVSTVLAEISDLALILLLMSFFRQKDDLAQSDVPASRFLQVAARATTVVWGLWLFFNMIRGILAPYTYLQIRNYAAQTGRPAPTAADIVGELLRAMLSAACWFSVPYIVYRSLTPSRTEAMPDQAAPPETHELGEDAGDRSPGPI
jgi:hypothetical protein